jgi:3-hydroxyisobutyrate dehydrogenase-like beta-hydroxyacid dehydrogenase
MARRTRKNVGVIGLGIIGSRVTDNLRRKGFHVFVWNKTPRPTPNFVGAPAELAEMCDYIEIFVSDDDALLDVVRQMAPALAPRHIVLAHPTVAPHTMRTAADIVERRGGRFIEAPFTGSKMGAEKGELVFYVAGDELALREARPILEASSKQIIEIGEIGQATVIKLATNIITAATVQAIAEALALVHNAGIPPEKFVAAVQDNASYSRTLEMKLPKMIAGDFEPHFSLKHMLKDMQLASRFGLSHHLELAVSSAVRDRLLEQDQRGHADEDYSVVARKYFPEILPASDEEVNLELFEKPPPIEPAATISSMGEVAAAVPPADVVAGPEEPPAPEPAAQPEAEAVLTNVIAPVTFVTPEQETTPTEPGGTVETEAAVGEQTAASEEVTPQSAPEESIDEPARRGLFDRLLHRDSGS